MTSINLSLRRTRFNWRAPEANNAPITTYWITYCTPIMDSTCINRTEVSVMNPSENPMTEIIDFNPDGRYRVTIQAENAAGRGPESQPYFFNSATRGGCYYMCRLYVKSLLKQFFLKALLLTSKLANYSETSTVGTPLMPFQVSRLKRC